MQAENWKQIKEILNEVLAFEISDRKSFLDASGIDPELRAEVESLIGFEEESADLMQLSAVEFSQDFMGDDAGSLSGQEIGAYRLIREVGHGGMGAVYLAERIDGKFQQKVALKLLKREMNTSSLRRRFEQEREILASLDHPNIARLLDAGTSNEKVPFIAMEYVDGLPIDKYCSAHGLDLNARLELFRTVCAAVEFAHRNLVVHRDLKPSNVLVTHDGVPKLLDFGISKIISKGYEEADSATITRMGVMTPSYASPEQLRQQGVTTLSDVYSLGVILFELLSGHRPFEEKEDDLREIFAAVIEKEPVPPSSLIATLPSGQPPSFLSEDAEAQGLETRASFERRTAPVPFALPAQSVRGDLDNIVLKALRKEPARRYASAGNLSEDIHRHLQGLTVTARPNTFSYRASKFVARNRVSVLAAAIVTVALIGGIVATVWQSRVAAAERDRAKQQAQKSEKVSSYLRNILNFSNPHWLSSNPERNRNATIAQAMEEALKNIDTELAGEPEIQAEILFAICTSYTQQARYAEAEEIARKAIANFDQALGEGNLRSMQVSVVLADILMDRAKYDEAQQLFEKAINYFRPMIENDKSQSKWLVVALNQLGTVYNYKGKLSEGEAAIRESNEYAIYVTGKDRVVVPIVLASLGNVLVQRGKFLEGLDFIDKAYDEMKAAGTDRKLEGGQALTAKGRTHTMLGDFERAEGVLQTGYLILVENVGENNFFSTLAMYSIANNYYLWGKYPEARSMIDRALNAAHKTYPKGHASIGVYTRLSGAIYTKTGDPKRGEAELRRALVDIGEYFKEPNQEIALINEALGENLIAQKRFDEARSVLTRSIESYSKTKGEDHPFTKRCRDLLGSLPE